jgi:hypothetical protein
VVIVAEVVLAVSAGESAGDKAPMRSRECDLSPRCSAAEEDERSNIIRTEIGRRLTAWVEEPPDYNVRDPAYDLDWRVVSAAIDTAVGTFGTNGSRIGL